MDKYFNDINHIPLFAGIEKSNFKSLLTCLSGKLESYDKHQTVLFSGDIISSFGVVISGKVQVIQDDYYGNNNIISILSPGQLFGESFACGGPTIFPFTVTTTKPSVILFIDCSKLAMPCRKACSFHSQIIQNLLSVISTNNRGLTEKMQFITKRSTREKLLAYLSAQARKADSHSFLIPFNRQELADYLSVDRSAMSAELSKLKRDGIIKYRKNKFELCVDSLSSDNV